MIENVWQSLLIKNPTGLACALTIWLISGAYATAILLGFVSGSLAFIWRYCVVASAFVLVLMPLIDCFSKRRD
ncbi:MAG: hypothetical protein EOP35_01960 [Rubrivivax sp.]|nr:MAG: hypothetical protein EOP35_01960 [Rubrivivax sp.]